MSTSISGSTGISKIQDGVATDEKLLLTANSPAIKTALNASGDAPISACRAWVNFDGTTTPPTIRASFNVDSVVRNDTGDYTVNFTTAMPDANYSTVVAVTGRKGSDGSTVLNQGGFAATGLHTNTAITYTTSAVRVYSSLTNGNANDSSVFCVSVFR